MSDDNQQAPVSPSFNSKRAFFENRSHVDDNENKHKVKKDKESNMMNSEEKYD